MEAFAPESGKGLESLHFSGSVMGVKLGRKKKWEMARIHCKS